MDKRRSLSFPLQWCLLTLALLLFAGSITYNLLNSHRVTDTKERHRLLTQARVVAENLDAQLMATDRVLLWICGKLSNRTVEAATLLKEITETYEL